MFFIMFNHPKIELVATPKFVDFKRDVDFFDTEEDARIAADDTILGSQLGYEIFEFGKGEKDEDEHDKSNNGGINKF